MAPRTFEHVLEQVGDRGRHQQLLYWLFMVPINFIIPWIALVPIFLTSTPDHWCKVEGRPTEGVVEVTEEEWKTLTLPRNSEGAAYESCKQYDVDVSTLLTLLNGTLAQGGSIATLAASLNNTFKTTECQDGWEYDHTSFDHTLTTRQDWVCGRESLSSTWISVGVAGNVIGTLIFNSLSDIIGRRPVVVLCMLVYFVFGIARLYVNSTWALMLTMFLASTSFPPILELTNIIILEQVSPQLRSRITSTSFLLWTFGSSLLPLLAWSTRDWQLLGLVTTIPFILFGLCWWLLPESPRWLLSCNRIKECEDLLRKIAKRNGREAPTSLEDTLEKIFKLHNDDEDKNYGALQLCKFPTVRFRTILLTACYTLNNFFYYGLIYNITNVSGNEFINFFLMSITELPSNLMGWWASSVIGRRWTAAGCFFIASGFALATAIVTVSNSVWGPIVLLLLSKVFINISFLLVYIQCAEIYPTTHRSCGTGLSSFVSSCFGVLSPYISYVSSQGLWIPYFLLFLVGMAGFVSAAFLPETLNKDLPQSLSDAEDFLTTEKFWSYKGTRLRTKRLSISKGKDDTVFGIDNPALGDKE
ncbi:hypothetical protein Pmani_034673 [Petrolisthes manimaculis]|uniref:Major facilitator superfamily (MFS) profile domain-containing protein n=1 Tax=Petrolisthes manimaculis TaxID=1843537 RepID=A0AAE1NNX1_9EUCA|nr:hypothetical protein Pmani_034673 [Petrolisthes manimaculis]